MSDKGERERCQRELTDGACMTCVLKCKWPDFLCVCVRTGGLKLHASGVKEKGCEAT